MTLALNGNDLPTLAGNQIDTLIARVFFLVRRPMGGFDPDKYLDEVTTNTDFCKHDDTVSFVIDCPIDCIDQIRSLLDQHMAAGSLRYGMNVSETALKPA